ncbi:MAG: 6-phosphogluconolactonase [Cocleimonas sp.]|nr:6-phosphogluconolactonase [Cocleimonas sp.]
MKINKNTHWQIKTTPEAVALSARDIIIDAAQQSIDARDIFKIVLAGGTTPKRIYELLTKASCSWEKWHIYLGDERCLPIEDGERNSFMIQQVFLDNVDIPAENIHFIPAELGAVKAASEYAQTLHSAYPFDLVMLGMGEDGHTASLFPKHTHKVNEAVHAVFNAPKPPANRVSMSATSLSKTITLLRIITGASKSDSIALWKEGENLPITTISSREKDIVLLDRSAMADL